MWYCGTIWRKKSHKWIWNHLQHKFELGRGILHNSITLSSSSMTPWFLDLYLSFIFCQQPLRRGSAYAVVGGLRETGLARHRGSSSRLTSTPPTDCEITVRGFEDGQTRDKQAFVFVPGLAHYKAGYDVDPNHAPSPIPGQLNASIWCFQWCRNVRACERLKRRKTPLKCSRLHFMLLLTFDCDAVPRPVTPSVFSLYSEIRSPKVT